MPNVSILGDTGDACPNTSPAPIVSGSGTVLVEGTPCTLVGSPIANGSVVVGGSGSVLVEGQPLVRVGDPTSCGSIIGSGASTVIAN
jgi:uncharacterized Zn-binding protein involved in type VI secretion